MAHNFRQFNDSPNQLVPGTPWLPIPFCGSPAAEVPEIRSQIISSELSGFDFGACDFLCYAYKCITAATECVALNKLHVQTFVDLFFMIRGV